MLNEERGGLKGKPERLRDETQKMALAKHEDMVEQFAPESADKALGEGIHVRGPDRGANDLGADGFEQAREPSAWLGVAIDDKHFGLDVQRCVARLLRTPVVGRRSGDCSVHDSPSLQIEKEQDENRAEEQVEGLHELTSPGDVVALHGALRDPDSKLEQLTSKPLSAPPWFRAAISRISVAWRVGLRPRARDRHRHRRRAPASANPVAA